MLKTAILQQKLNEIVIQESSAENRHAAFSFIITDAEGNPIITRGVDPELDAKIDSFDANVNENERNSLTEDERVLFQSTLARMQEKNPPRKIPMLFEHRQLKGYVYYGDADPSEIAHLPFVITDTAGVPQKWQIWADVVTANNATYSN